MLPILATAQLSSTQKIVAQVPFEFVVGSKVIPAGELILHSASMDGKILSIRTRDSKVNMFSEADRDETKTPAADYALVFHKYGNNAFLWGLKLKNSRTIYRLPQSKAEAELLARNTPATEEILLASLQ
jgi:hypothetical protein